MKKVAEIIIGAVGLYLIINALTELARRSWSVSSSAGFSEYMLIFGPSIILSASGLLCIIFRNYISLKILKVQEFDLPDHIDLNRIECIVFSIIGLIALFQILPLFVLTVNNYVITPEIQKTEYGDLPVKRYMFVQVVALGVELLLSLALILIPKKIQTTLNKIRGF